MGYVQELRSLVGRRPLILPGAEVIVVDERGRVLLQKRADNGLWAIPGGYLEPGESFEEAARREVREEAGIEVGRLELLDIFSGSEFFYRYPNGDEVYNVSAAYIAREHSGETSTDAESVDAGFYPLDRLPGPVIFLNQIVLDRYLEKYG